MKKILMVLTLFLLLVGFVGAVQICEVYDDFSSGVLDNSKWEVRPDVEGQPLTEEYGVIEENGNFVFHTQQNTIGDKRTYLFPKKTFTTGDILEYDFNVVSKEGNYLQMDLLTGDQYIRAGIAGYINGVQGFDELGVFHIKIEFQENNFHLEKTSPSNATLIDNLALTETNGTYELYIGAVSGHNGRMHIDFDNFELCTEQVPLQCGDTITEDTIMTEDLLGCSGTALTLGVDNLVFDCSGHTIQGNGTLIDLRYRSNVTIKNCILQDGSSFWYEGTIYLYNSNNNLIENNSFINNTVGILLKRYSDNNLLKNNFFQGVDAGIILADYGNNKNTILNNIISVYIPSGPGSHSGIWAGIDLPGGKKNNIINNTVFCNQQSGSGIRFINEGATNILNNTIHSCSQGLSMYENVNDFENSGENIITGNHIFSNYATLVFSWNDPKINQIINYNNLEDNTYFDYFGYVPNKNQSWYFDSRYNWWGTTNKTEIEDKIYLYSSVSIIPFLCEPYPTNWISDENGNCVLDSDNDGVPDDEDKCSNTASEQIVYGCSCEQILEIMPGNANQCSQGIIDIFTKQIGWAKDLFG